MKRSVIFCKRVISSSVPAVTLFSGAIQRLTKSVWSHVAIVYKDVQLGRIMVLEAEPGVGIRLIPLSNYLRNYKGKNRPYKGQVVIAKLNIDLESLKLNRAISFGLDELTPTLQ